MSHTKEPWHIKCHTCETPADINEGDDYTITGADGNAIAFEPSGRNTNCGADARRIVACVNACAGMKTEELENYKREYVLGMHVFDLVKQRDDLLAALEKMNRAYVNLLENGRDRIVMLGGECDPVDLMEATDLSLRESREAIASVKGGAA